MSDTCIQTNMTGVLPYIRPLPVYVAGRSEQSVAREYNLSRIIKLASNENPLGCSPYVVNALADIASRSGASLARYPESDAPDLRAELGHYHGVSPDQIAVTNGSHELIDLCAALVLREGRVGLYSQYAFQAYPISIRMRGADAWEVEARHYAHDVDAICAELEADSEKLIRLVYLCNPNNPTGTLMAASDVERVVATAGKDRLVVLDEAYIDFVDPSLRVDSIALVARHPHLVVARTFSKAYGLASLRIGYGVMSTDMVDMIARIRPTFSVNALAQYAASVALVDRKFLGRTQSSNRAGIAQVIEVLDTNEIDYIPTHANFIAIRFPNAQSVAQRLLEAGVVVRPLGAYRLEDFIRVTIGTEEENRIFLNVLLDKLNDL
ncbi:histidinol-phosphate transaminase [Burkholderia orbicola]|uniref:histidinol-phosphate transaminase n=1 Tax=Burkholderia orbicola TaxID=2978683 RepID=UPI003AF4C078